MHVLCQDSLSRVADSKSDANLGKFLQTVLKSNSSQYALNELPNLSSYANLRCGNRDDQRSLCPRSKSGKTLSTRRKSPWYYATAISDNGEPRSVVPTCFSQDLAFRVAIVTYAGCDERKTRSRGGYPVTESCTALLANSLDGAKRPRTARMKRTSQK